MSVTTTMTGTEENNEAKDFAIDSPSKSPFILNLIFLPDHAASHSQLSIETVVSHLDHAGHGVTACVAGCQETSADFSKPNDYDLDTAQDLLQNRLHKIPTVVRVDVNASVDTILNQAISQLHQKYASNVSTGVDTSHFTPASSSYIPRPTDPLPSHRYYHESFAAHRLSSVWYNSLADLHTQPPVFSLYTPRPLAHLDAERRNCLYYRPYSRISSSILHIVPTAHRADQLYSLLRKIPSCFLFALFVYNHRNFFEPNLRLLIDLDIESLIKSFGLMWESFALDVQNYMFELYIQSL